MGADGGEDGKVGYRTRYHGRTNEGRLNQGKTKGNEEREDETRSKMVLLVKSDIVEQERADRGWDKANVWNWVHATFGG